MLEAQVRKLEASVARLGGGVEWSARDDELTRLLRFAMSGSSQTHIDGTVRKLSEQLRGLSSDHFDFRRPAGRNTYEDLRMTDQELNDFIVSYYDAINRVTPTNPDKYTLTNTVSTPNPRTVNILNELALYEGANLPDAASNGFASPKVRYMAALYTSDPSDDPTVLCICHSVMQMVDDDERDAGLLRRITVRPITDKRMAQNLTPE